MKNRVLGLLGMVGILALGSGCTSVEPDAGFEAVLIAKPVMFGHGGVLKETVKTGRTYAAITTDAVYINMQPIQHDVHFDDLQSSEGIPLDFDATIRLQVLDSAGLYERYGEKWYENNVKTDFMKFVRQAVRKHGMNETAISTTAIEAIDAEVTAEMDKYLTDTGIPVKLLQVTVGKANPPEEIKNQRVATAAQEQRKLTEDKRKLAEDARKEAEMSRATADNAYRQAMQMSPDQFLSLEQIKMMRDVCSGGKCTFLNGASSVQPTIDVGSK